jgi:PTS system mannose-specific IIB component
MLRLLEVGVPMNHINLGGMGAGPGRAILHQHISVSEAELITLRQIQAKGVKIELKMVPSDRGMDFATLGAKPK